MGMPKRGRQLRKKSIVNVDMEYRYAGSFLFRSDLNKATLTGNGTYDALLGRVKPFLFYARRHLELLREEFFSFVRSDAKFTGSWNYKRVRTIIFMHVNVLSHHAFCCYR